MPNWVAAILIPYIVPIFMPVIVETAKNALAWIFGKLPQSIDMVLASTLGEGANQLQAYFTAHPLPLGLSGTVASIVNLALADVLKKQPPTLVPPPA